TWELKFENDGARPVSLTFYPISMVFNGPIDVQDHHSNYDFKARTTFGYSENNYIRYDYLNGVNTNLIYVGGNPDHWQINTQYTIGTGSVFYFNQDGSANVGCDASF